MDYMEKFREYLPEELDGPVDSEGHPINVLPKNTDDILVEDSFTAGYDY